MLLQSQKHALQHSDNVLTTLFPPFRSLHCSPKSCLPLSKGGVLVHFYMTEEAARGETDACAVYQDSSCNEIKMPSDRSCCQTTVCTHTASYWSPGILLCLNASRRGTFVRHGKHFLFETYWLFFPHNLPLKCCWGTAATGL